MRKNILIYLLFHILLDLYPWESGSTTLHVRAGVGVGDGAAAFFTLQLQPKRMAPAPQH